MLENVLCLSRSRVASLSWVGPAIERSGIVPYAHFGLNLRIFACAFALAVLFGVLSGVYPAWRMSRLHPVLALRGGTT